MFGNIVKTHIGPILDLEYALWTRFKSLTYDLKNAFLALGDDGSYLCKALQMRIQWDKKP